MTRTAPQEGIASRRPSPIPSLTPGTENAQGHYAASRGEAPGSRDFRGPDEMPVEGAHPSGAPLRPVPIVTSRGERLEPERISGPSFLGLASGDSSSTSDYLLEEPQRSHWRAWLVLIVLLIIGGLFYLQWRTNWRAQPHDETPPSMPSASPPNPPQGKAAPASDATGVPAAENPQEAKSKPETTQPDTTKPPDKPAASPAASENVKPDENKAADETPASSDNDNAGGSVSAAPPAKPHRQPIADRQPDSPTHADPGRDPMLYMAQKYLHGGDAGRNCDQAMIYLRAANQKPSAPARSQMGALYATGTCVPLDRVLAYQWFTSALNVEPNSEELRRERVNLWAQMSSDERQRAVK